MFGSYNKPEVSITGGTPIAPAENAIAVIDYLSRSGNKSMDVNGSVTPRVFSLTVPAGQTWYVTELRMFLADSEIKKRDEFGAVNELSNGFLVEFNINSTDYQHSNTINNVELSITFPSYIDNGDNTNNLAAEKDSFYGRDRFQIPVCLREGDSIKATVRDNLNGLDELYMAVQYWRAI